MTRPACTAIGCGTLKAYNAGRCTCPAGLAAHARDEKHRSIEAALGRPRRMDATGTRRRVRALCALGWTLDEIGDRLGITRDGVWRLTRRRFVNRSTHVRVAAVYGELADRPGPSPLTAARAARKGWLAPLWWDDDTIDDPDYTPSTSEPVPTGRTRYAAHLADQLDDVVVERLIAGNPPPAFTSFERREAVRRLHRQGLGAPRIAERIGVHERQVDRDLCALGIDQKAVAA